MMTRKLSVLDHVRVAAPCPESWAGMTGDERVRHCARCNLNVYNLSEMSRTEAETLIATHEGRLCIGYYQRPDGTILTRNCPVGVMMIRRRLARLLGGVAAAFAFLAGGLHALARGERGSQELRLRYFRPFDRIIAWLTPAASGDWMSGASVALPPTHRQSLESPKSSAELQKLFDEIELEHVHRK